MVLLVASVAVAQTNRIRDLAAESTTGTLINRCELPGDTSASGWDLTPTLGGWGGLDESQFAVVWEPFFNDTPSSRMASCVIPGTTGKKATKIIVQALKGLANDDYCVFASVGAGDLLIGCIDETSNTEVWGPDTFNLPVGAFADGQTITVTIQATGNAWPSFATWGQLAVDWIEVWD
jgi:hypothetical protein